MLPGSTRYGIEYLIDNAESHATMPREICQQVQSNPASAASNALEYRLLKFPLNLLTLFIRGRLAV